MASRSVTPSQGHERSLSGTCKILLRTFQSIFCSILRRCIYRSIELSRSTAYFLARLFQNAALVLSPQILHCSISKLRSLYLQNHLETSSSLTRRQLALVTDSSVLAFIPDASHQIVTGSIHDLNQPSTLIAMQAPACHDQRLSSEMSVTSLEGSLCGSSASLAALLSALLFLRSSFHFSSATMIWVAALAGTRVPDACNRPGLQASLHLLRHKLLFVAFMV